MRRPTNKKQKHSSGRGKRLSLQKLCLGLFGFIGILYLYFVTKFALSTKASLSSNNVNALDSVKHRDPIEKKILRDDPLVSMEPKTTIAYGEIL